MNTYNFKYRFDTIWYATPARRRSLTKLLVFDDQGTMDITEDGFTFRGQHAAIHVTNIESVNSAKQQLPWITYAWSITLTIIISGAILGSFLFFVSTYLAFNLHYIGWRYLFILVGLFIFSTLSGILIGLNTPWVEITYRDKNNVQQILYLAEASLMGWGGMFGGTKRLKTTLQTLIP